MPSGFQCPAFRELERPLTTIYNIQGYSDLVVRNPLNCGEAVELGNMLTISRMVCQAALERRESRGAHYRRAYPRRTTGNG